MIPDILLQKQLVKRKLPVNIDMGDSACENFQKLAEEESYEIRKLEFDNVSVNSASIVFKRMKSFKESFCKDNAYFNDRYNSWKFFLKSYLRIPVGVRRCDKGRAHFLISDKWSGNYFHWLVEVLARIEAIRSVADDAVFVFPEKYLKWSYVRFSLAALGIDKQDILLIEHLKRLKLKKLYMPSHAYEHQGNFAGDVIAKSRDRLLAHHGEIGADKDAGLGERIYVSRAGAGMRKIVNDDAVDEVLDRFGFKKVLMENYDFEEQISVMKRAKYLVGVHGAGLTNLMFMNKGSFVMELRRVSDYERGQDCFYCLACSLGVNYLYQKCDSKCAQGGDVHHADLMVDCDKLENNIRLMIEKGGDL